MTSPEPVDTAGELRPWLETYPRVYVALFLFGPLCVGGYFTDHAGWLISMISGLAGMLLGREIVLGLPWFHRAAGWVVRPRIPRRRL